MEDKYTQMVLDIQNEESEKSQNFKKDMQTQDKLIKTLENRLKDLNEVVQAKNQEIKNFQNVLSTIEEMQKKG